MTETSSLRLLTAVLFLGAVLIFWNLGGDALIHWDEGRTAERAREILVFHDWITLHLNYQPDFAKPPLYYWLTALLYQLIGVNEFAARFWAAWFGVLGLYAVSRLGTLLFSVAVGTVAAALLLTVTFCLEYARAAILDTGLLSFGVMALCAFLSHSLLLGWTFLGIGFMLKGRGSSPSSYRCQFGGLPTTVGKRCGTPGSTLASGSCWQSSFPGTRLSMCCTGRCSSTPTWTKRSSRGYSNL
jgi:4-amino-4-deoxy-L-arabinose transferase-like glycosyltransferase